MRRKNKSWNELKNKDMFTLGLAGGFIAGTIVGGLVMVFIVRSNPQLILSADAIAKAYESIKKIL